MRKDKGKMHNARNIKEQLRKVTISQVPIDIKCDEQYILQFSSLPETLCQGDEVACFFVFVGDKVMLPKGWALVVWLRPMAKGSDWLLPTDDREYDNEGETDDCGYKTAGGSEQRPLLGSSHSGTKFTIHPRITQVDEGRLSVQVTFFGSPAQITGKKHSRLHLSANIFKQRRPVGATPKVPLHFHSHNHRKLEGTVDYLLTDPKTGDRSIFFCHSKPSLPAPYHLTVNPYVLGADPKTIFKEGEKVSLRFNPQNMEVVSFPCFE